MVETWQDRRFELRREYESLKKIDVNTSKVQRLSNQLIMPSFAGLGLGELWLSGRVLCSTKRRHILALVGLSPINLPETELNVRPRVPSAQWDHAKSPAPSQQYFFRLVDPSRCGGGKVLHCLSAYEELVGFESWLDVDSADGLARGAAVVPHFRYPQWGS